MKKRIYIEYIITTSTEVEIPDDTPYEEQEKAAEAAGIELARDNSFLEATAGLQGPDTWYVAVGRQL